MNFVLGLILAIAIPFLALAAICKLDLYQTGQFKYILYSLSWGVVAYGLASSINRFLIYSTLADDTSLKIFYSPIHEELLKGLILLVMVNRSKLTYSFDGALYGFAAGIGFAIIENFDYMVVDAAEAAGTAVQRVISANLVHASSSAIIGIALGMAYVKRSPLRWMAFAAGLFLAIGQHSVYNMVSLIQNPLPSAVSIGLLGIVFVIIAIYLGKKQAQKWIRQKLGMDDGITRNEVVAVDRLATTDEILLPVLERFGAEKASQVEKLLYLEARLGLKRKALDSFQNNPAMRDTLEAEIRAMRKQVKKAHRTIGIYAMLFVRGLFTDEMISVWNRMHAKVREQSQWNGSRKGGGLWTTLEERLKAPSDAKRHE